jgi:hypothetical protein
MRGVCVKCDTNILLNFAFSYIRILLWYPIENLIEEKNDRIQIFWIKISFTLLYWLIYLMIFLSHKNMNFIHKLLCKAEKANTKTSWINKKD